MTFHSDGPSSPAHKHALTRLAAHAGPLLPAPPSMLLPPGNAHALSAWTKLALLATYDVLGGGNGAVTTSSFTSDDQQVLSNLALATRQDPVIGVKEGMVPHPFKDKLEMAYTLQGAIDNQPYLLGYADKATEAKAPAPDPELKDALKAYLKKGAAKQEPAPEAEPAVPGPLPKNWVADALTLAQLGGWGWPAGEIGKRLKPIVTAHGWEAVRPAWEFYCMKALALGVEDGAGMNPLGFARRWAYWAKMMLPV